MSEKAESMEPVFMTDHKKQEEAIDKAAIFL
jgi:hypothetical protein